MKLKKRRKSGRFRGSRMHGNAAKKSKGKGNRGGKGMSGTGKKAGQKKNFVERLYGSNYFGKQGITSRSGKKKHNNVINVGDINRNYDSGEVNLEDYKILGEGEVTKKFTIKAKSFSSSAKEKIEKSGGKIISKSEDKEE